MAAGRPKKEFNRKLFTDLVGIGCTQKEICWMFRDEDGTPANIDTLSRWCKREFGMNFQEYSEQNSGIVAKIQVRKNQIKLSEKSAAMAIFLGKNLLGQTDKDSFEQELTAAKIEALKSGSGSDSVNAETRKQLEELINNIPAEEENGTAENT